LAELRYGADCSAQPDANHQAIDDFVSGVDVLDVDADIARAFGKIKAQLRRQGNLIEDFDLLLAATALTNNLTLVTSNTAHFGRIGGLTLDNWAQT
jgi:tRNA(fMet)-specific endonuclease VapC